MSSVLKKIKKLAHHTHVRVVFAVVFIGILVGAAYGGYQVVYRICCSSGPSVIPISVEEEYRAPYQRALDGVGVERVDDQYPPVAVAVIDNHPNARPAQGLVDAPVVYEVPVEGLFTRYLALWPMHPLNSLAAATSTYEGKIGPVRSARPYMIDIVAEYDAMFAHVGGSPQALEQLKTQQRILDVNEFSKRWYFWRDTRAFAPHNVLTTLALLAQAHEERFEDHEESVFTSWGFTDEANVEGEDEGVWEAKVIRIDWPEQANIVEWEFDETQRYRRYRGGRKHIDQDGEQVIAGTVIVQYVDIAVIDDYGRLDVGLIGSGDGVVYRDGYAFPVTWQKPTQPARTQWRGADGELVPMKTGAPVWVHVVPSSVHVQEFGFEELL